MRRVLAASAALLFAANPAFAARDNGLPGEFLNYGVGGRPLGMGRAYTAVADDIDALYWNPAGMSLYRSSQVEFQYSPLTDGGAHQFLAYSQPLYAYGNLGVGVVNLVSGSIERADQYNVPFGSFSSRETGYLVSYGQRIGSKLGLGTTLKMAEHVMDAKTERGYGMDAGGMWSFGERARAGLMLKNLVQPSYSYDTETEKFPRIMRGGGALKFLEGHLQAALDLEKTLGASQGLKWHMGVEGFVFPDFTVRAGLDQSEITAGVGIRLRTLQLDYAAGFQDLGLTNRVSFRAYFGGYEVDVKASPSVFSPVGLKNKTTFKIAAANRQRVVHWILSIRTARGTVVQTFQGYTAPPKTLEWDGRNSLGQVVPPGEYRYRMAVTDNRRRTETTPPRTLQIQAPTPFEIEAK